MLLEIALGDAYGLGFEFGPPELFGRNDLSAYLPHGLHPITPGCYSDDTQRAIANTEVVFSRGPEATSLDFANAYVKSFHRDTRLGYSKAMYALLSSCTDGADLLKKVTGESVTGGCVMGVAPCGWVDNPVDVIYLANTQAAVTHRSDTAKIASKIVALAVFYGRKHVPQAKLREKVFAHLSVEELGHTSFLQYTGKHPVSQNAIDITTAALKAVETGKTLSQVLQVAVSYMGDTDTVAAVAMGIASTFMENDIPDVLVKGLENGNYGYDYLRSMDLRYYG